MKLTLCLPYFNQLQDTKGILGLFKYNTSDDVEWMVIDNGSTDPIEGYIKNYIKPKRLNFIRNEENLGLVKTMQQSYENCETELLAIIHNDVFIFEKNWDKRVLATFERMSDLGLIGFFGAQGCLPDGARAQDIYLIGQMAGLSNMLEAEVHGIRMKEEIVSTAVIDGFAMIFKMEMLKKGNGFDQRYYYHHIYDRDASLESIRRGYKNIVLNVPCHHIGGITACRPEYQEWVSKKTDKENGDLWTHDENTRIFMAKWGRTLPIYINNDFTFRISDAPHGLVYAGDAITRL